MEAREWAQHLREYIALPEDQVHYTNVRWLITACNSNSRGSNAFF